MQKVILFIEPIDEEYLTPVKIGNIFMNRFAIDEDASSEILNIFELAKTSMSMSLPEESKYDKSCYIDFTKEKQHKGMNHFIKNVIH